MTGAGDTGVNNQAAAQQSTNPWAVNPWAMGVNFVSPNFQFPTYQMGNGGGGIKSNVNIKMNSTEGKEYLKTNAICNAVNDGLGAGLNMMSAYFQYSLAGKSMNAQRDLGLAQISAQVQIAGLQEKVASKQLDVQKAAVEAQTEMAHVDSETAIALRNIGAKESANLESIKQDGMSERTKIAASAGMFNPNNDPFSRGSYLYG